MIRAEKLDALDDYLRAEAGHFEDDLCQLLRIPSVSADPAHQGDVRNAAQWLASHLQSMGLTVEVVPTDGNPIVYAERLEAPGAPTVLVYGHYDVQPADPLDEWHTPPFEPTQREGNLFARGATDDKGQMLTHVKSVQAWLATAGRLPVNIKLLIEGEEEVGSVNLEPFVAAHREKLACDVVVVSDTSQFGPDLPAITYGLRGIAYYELRLTGPRQDLHSGTFGGGVSNPANALTRILAGLIDEQGHVQIPGFYDQIQPVPESEHRQMDSLPFDETEFARQVGVDALFGEKGYSTLQRRWARPSFDVNGLWGGYSGKGAKTVLPARAGAKFSFRLVPDQHPDRVTEGLKQRIGELCPPGIRWELEAFHGSRAVVVPLDSPFMAAASRAIEIGFGRPPVYIREGGSIPVVTTFFEELGVPTLLLGWGLNDDNAHSPNEKFRLADYHRGIRASAYLWRELAALA